MDKNAKRPAAHAVCCVVLAMCLGQGRAVAGAKTTIDLQSLLNEMVDRDRLARLPDPAYKTFQASSYDRRSVSPELPGWFANNDTAQFIGTETAQGREEHVMMDAKGPGCVTRFWMGAPQPDKGPSGMLRIYLDGSSTPVIAEVADTLLSGQWRVGPPLLAITCIGRNFYLPIPFARRCKITYEGGGNCWYNIEYRRYPPGTKVRSFSIDDLKAAGPTLDRVQKTLLQPDGAVEPAAKVLVVPRRTLEPGASLTEGLKGPAAIRTLSIRLAASDLTAALRSTIIRIEFDNELCVWCPVGDFFGSGIGLNPYRDWTRQVTADGVMTCRWVMPFDQTCRIELRNLGREPVDATVESIAAGPWDWDDRSMHFHANWRQEYPIHTKKAEGTRDWNYITIEGHGVYVGDTLALHNGAGPWWGEGDEKIYIDGEIFPSHFGTGTEDYYGFSYGDRGTFFEAPFHAEPRWDGNNKEGYVTVTRNRSLDAISFDESFKFDMEIWHWSATDVAYAATTYWYAVPGALSNRPPAPAEAARPVPGTQ